MGAANISTFEADQPGFGGTRAKDAYARAVEKARYECGHDTYNGTISTTEGFIIRPETARTEEELRGLRQAGWDDTVKWGSCWAVRTEIGERKGWTFIGWAAE